MINYFSKNLKYLRNKKNISQSEIARKTKINQTSFTKWETGEVSPSIDNVVKIASALNVELPDLLGKDLSENEDFAFSELDNVLFSKAKDLSDNDKKVILNVIDSIKKNVDEEENR